MKKIMTRAAETALAAGVAGGVLLLGSSAAGAQEAEPPTTAEGDGLLAGNAVNADVDVPVTLCGIAGVGARRGHRDLRAVRRHRRPSRTRPWRRPRGTASRTGNAVGPRPRRARHRVRCGRGRRLVGSGVCNGGCARRRLGRGRWRHHGGQGRGQRLPRRQRARPRRRRPDHRVWRGRCPARRGHRHVRHGPAGSGRSGWLGDVVVAEA